ncbi:hypothetical protein hp908_0775 [Helicobacter pylori 908]|nr:hypothetical protein hp908_0775 [Helicobacter pylori 908]ADZ49844.1 hypothetical protein hp2017_0743 [Helicobacter pylori 2017]ADZ51446.1 hypothetical protein hp2018_0744 [Helicobacter pylori 2018]
MSFQNKSLQANLSLTLFFVLALFKRSLQKSLKIVLMVIILKF